MALGETGQCSSHTRQSRPSVKGIHRARLIKAVPILLFCFTSRGILGMAPVGQTWGAQGAIIFTVTQSGNQARGVEAVQARLPPGRLQRSRGQTLKHSPQRIQRERNAASDSHPGRADHRIHPVCRATEPESDQRHGHNTGGHGGHHLPPSQSGSALAGRPPEFKGHPALLARPPGLLHTQLALGHLVLWGTASVVRSPLILHTSWQSPQSGQSLPGRRRSQENRATRPYKAPKGHKARHQKRRSNLSRATIIAKQETVKNGSRKTCFRKGSITAFRNS